jgi:hypothetical protein
MARFPHAGNDYSATGLHDRLTSFDEGILERIGEKIEGFGLDLDNLRAAPKD